MARTMLAICLLCWPTRGRLFFSRFFRPPYSRTRLRPLGSRGGASRSWRRVPLCENDVHPSEIAGARPARECTAEWLPEGAKPPFDYEVDPKRAEHFYREVRRYWPGLKDGALSPDYSGVRPKIVGKGQPSADFLIDGPEAHGVAGLVNLIGIESPGLTSSLAIGEMAARLV